MGFRTKLDYSDNRQIKQHIETLTHLSGATTFGVPFNQLPSGPDLTTSGITETLNSVGSLFSGNGTTTIFEWYDNRMEIGYPFLSAITPSNSGITQNVPVTFTASSTTIIDGNTIALAYSGVSFDLTPIAMYDLGGGDYSGTVVSNIVDFISATTLDFTGRTIWVDVSGMTRTNELIVSKDAQIGYILTCVDSEGTVSYQPLSGNTGFTTATFWSAGTGTNAIVTKNSGNISSGISSVAEGYLSVAGGWASHAEGLNTTALGTQGAHSEGHQTKANGIRSHAEGAGSIANGDGAHAEGKQTIANGVASHAEGQSTTAQNDYSHSEGYFSIASGISSHAEGYFTTASGDYGAHAEGASTTASGNYSHAEGGNTIASGPFSHAEGDHTTANGNYSHTEGFYTTANNIASHAEGYLTIASGNTSHAEGYLTTASGNYSHAEGDNTIASGLGSHAEGNGIAQGLYSHAEGGGTAIGITSHAEGSNTIARGEASHAEGSSVANGDYSHAGGFGTQANGHYSRVSGNLSVIASGASYSFVHGNNSTANASNVNILGANITGNTTNTTYVDNLNIKTLGAGATSILGIDVNGKVVNYGSALFSGGTVSGNTMFSSGLSANSINISGVTVDRESLLPKNMLMSTGAYVFNGITMGTGNTFNVGLTKGFIIDSTDPLNVLTIPVNFSGQSNISSPFTGSTSSTHIFLNSGNTLTLIGTEPTPQQRRQSIYLGVIGHPNNLTGLMSGIGNRPDLCMNSMAQVRDMFIPIKFINEGVVISANSGMTISNTTGKIYGLGIGYDVNGVLNPTSRDILGAMPTTFQYRTQTGGTFSNTTFISGGSYDVNGIVTVIPGSSNQATNQRVFLLENGNIRIQFGQTIYATINAAVAAAQTELFTVFTNNKNLGLLIGIISVTKGAVNLTDSTQAYFLAVSKFGESVGASAGLSVSTMQNTYNNGAQPQIITTALNGAIQFRGYSTNATKILEIQSSAGTTSSYFTGGGISATTISGGTTVLNPTSLTTGINTTASGLYSFAQGNNTLASGAQSYAGGFNSIASGTYAHAEGSSTTASGPNGSHAEGVNTTASGSASHAEGVSTTAGGAASHAQGSSTRAIGDYSHSSGFGTLANNNYSFVHGSNSTANADYSIVLGRNMTATTSDTTYVDNLNIKTVPAGATIDIGVNASGFVTVQASDVRLKENIETLTNALDKIKALRGVKYQWIDKENYGDQFRIGFIAQEVNEVEPLLVTNIDGNLLGVQYKEVTALLVEAIKELSSGVTTSTNTYLETQTILAEDNNIDLNYNGTQETSIGGGVRVLNAKPNGESADFKTDIDGNWVTNNALKPDEIIIPSYTPSATTDTTGYIGSLSRDEDYLYIKGINGWKRTNLENF